MKRIIISLLLGAICLMAVAQSANPLAYSGKFYVKEMFAIHAMWYQSYDEHSVFHRTADIPITEPVAVAVDFSKNTISLNDKTSNISNAKVQLRPCNDQGDKMVLITFNMEGTNDLLYLEYFPYSKVPDLFQVTREEEGASVLVMRLSATPYMDSDAEALRKLLGNSAY